MPESKALVPASLSAIQAQYTPDKYNSLLPTTAIGDVPDCFTVAVRVVKIDIEDETYRLPGTPKLALKKTAMDKLANAAGVNWEYVRRIDDRRSPHYYEYEAAATVKDFDGSIRRSMASKVVDLRADDGTGKPGKDAAGMSDKQLPQAKKFAAEICASKAKNRAISDLLGIPRAMTPQQLAKPFVVPSLMLNANHPQALQAMLASACGATAALFGAQAQAPQRQVVEAAVVECDDAPLLSEYDAETGEVAEPAPEPEVPIIRPLKDVLAECWGRAKKIGITVEHWREIVLECGAPAKVEYMTMRHVEDICNRIDAEIDKAWVDA